MDKIWNINIDGYIHTVVFKSNIWTGKKKIIIDGKETVIKNKLFCGLTGIDESIKIGQKECRFVLNGGKADIAVDGRYINSKEAYEPLKGMPRWNWIFVFLCFIIPILSMGGAIPMVIALLGVMSCARISSSSRMSTPVKVICCVGIVVVCWILWGALIMLMANL